MCFRVFHKFCLTSSNCFIYIFEIVLPRMPETSQHIAAATFSFFFFRVQSCTYLCPFIFSSKNLSVTNLFSNLFSFLSTMVANFIFLMLLLHLHVSIVSYLNFICIIFVSCLYCICLMLLLYLRFICIVFGKEIDWMPNGSWDRSIYWPSHHIALSQLRKYN